MGETRKRGIEQKDKKGKKVLNNAFIVIEYIFFIFMFFFSALNAYDLFTAKNKAGDHSGYLELILVFVLIVVIYYLACTVQVILHEFGHMVCGLLSGYEFGSFRIFSLTLIKMDGKLRLKRFSLAGTGGQCLMSPPDTYSEDIPYKLYNYGGVLFNLICAAASIAVLALFPEMNAFVTVFVQFNLIFAVHLLLVNGIPLKIGSLSNDAMNIRDIKRSKKNHRAFWAQLYINRLNMQDIRLRDMPEELFILPGPSGGKDEGNLDMFIRFTRFSRMVDQIDFDSARSFGAELLAGESIEGIHIYPLLVNDMIMLELLGENRREEVDRLNGKKHKKAIAAYAKHPPVIVTQYALALLYNKNEKVAKRQLRLFEAVAKKYPYKCDIDSSRELIGIIDRAANSANECGAADSV